MIKLPYIGEPSRKFGKLISDGVSKCFSSVDVRCIFTSRTLRVNPVKDVLPTLSSSNVVYSFVCHCGSEYVGRTGASLLTRIGQHVPKKIRSMLTLNSSQSTTKDSGMPLRRSARIKSLKQKLSTSTVGQPAPVNVVSESSESSLSSIGEHLIKLCLNRVLVLHRLIKSFNLMLIISLFCNEIKKN